MQVKCDVICCNSRIKHYYDMQAYYRKSENKSILFDNIFTQACKLL